MGEVYIMLIDTLLYFGVEFLGFRNGVKKKLGFELVEYLKEMLQLTRGDRFCGLDVCVASWGKKD